MQAAGYTTNFSPAKLVQAGASGGAAWTGGMQDALLSGGGSAKGASQLHDLPACLPASTA